jgi:hypothetical protein
MGKVSEQMVALSKAIRLGRKKGQNQNKQPDVRSTKGTSSLEGQQMKDQR